MPDDKGRGLYDKYAVSRNDGKPLGACVVLEFGDPIARNAIFAWAREMRRSGYSKVYDDAITLLAQTLELTISVGDYFWMDDASHWKVIAIEGEIVRLELSTGGAWPLYPTKKKYKREMSLLDLKRFLVENPQ